MNATVIKPTEKLNREDIDAKILAMLDDGKRHGEIASALKLPLAYVRGFVLNHHRVKNQNHTVTNARMVQHSGMVTWAESSTNILSKSSASSELKKAIKGAQATQHDVYVAVVIVPSDESPELTAKGL